MRLAFDTTGETQKSDGNSPARPQHGEQEIVKILQAGVALSGVSRARAAGSR
jgi:hypothetical protein